MTNEYSTKQAKINKLAHTIETQLKSNSSTNQKIFRFTIDGDLAYLYIGHGLSANYNREQLIDAITNMD